MSSIGCKSVIIAANPKSGSKSRLELVHQLAGHIESKGFDVHVEFELGELEARIADRWGNGSLATVIAAGGDGTVNAVAARAPSGVPITVLPLGSENLLAKYYGWNLSVEACAERVERAESIVLDAMEINGRLGLIMVSVGFDSEVVRLVHSNRKSHITRWAYRTQAIRAWLTYRWPVHRIKFHCDETDREEIVHGQWFFVFNLPKYATELHILDDADPSDGLLDLGVFTESGPIKGLFQYLDVLRGRHRKRSDWVEKRIRGLHCENLSARENASRYESSYQFDGDSGGEMPMQIRVLAKRVTLLR
jgi:diacylglycerol kinase family enzyme